jgi:release factor glutamine methyltransferase
MLIQDYLRSNTTDIEYLLELALNTTKTWIWSNPDYKLSPTEKSTVEHVIQQRKNGVPFAYLKGEKPFYHLDFIVNKHTLIPRPETENIIEIVKDLQMPYAKILDLGTGSGVIAITLKSLFPHYEIIALDNNTQTLEVAKHNAIKHNADITFITSNWFENITDTDFDIIISNPPYIDKNDLHLQDLHDPIGSLVAEDNGLKDINEIIENTPKYLKKDGFLLLEHGYNQQQEITALLTQFARIKTFKDFNKQDRNILAQL